VHGIWNYTYTSRNIVILSNSEEIILVEDTKQHAMQTADGRNKDKYQITVYATWNYTHTSQTTVIFSNSEEIITCGRHKNTQSKLQMEKWKEQRENTERAWNMKLHLY